MNSRTFPRLRAPRLPRAARRGGASAAATAAFPDAPNGLAGLSWIHDGVRHRVSPWPEVVFARETSPGVWEESDPSPAALASAMLGVIPARWRSYLEYVPAPEREFLRQFAFSRLTALLVRVRCPVLAGELRETPALTAYVAAHLELRGGGAATWAEIGAVFEREGVFGLLQWLGLPASRQTLRILRCISDPDLPLRLLAPLRAALWEPQASGTLSRAAALSDEQLARACHALAA